MITTVEVRVPGEVEARRERRIVSKWARAGNRRNGLTAALKESAKEVRASRGGNR